MILEQKRTRSLSEQDSLRERRFEEGRYWSSKTFGAKTLTKTHPSFDIENTDESEETQF